MPVFKPVTVIVRGEPDSGKSTLANLIKLMLEESGYKHVMVKDIEPLPHDQKDRFPDRFERNRLLREVNIVVELEK